MPSPERTRWAQLKVGVMALFALLILAALIILMSGVNPLFRRSTDVFTYLPDSLAMTEGATPVRLNGILIGKVAPVRLIEPTTDGALGEAAASFQPEADIIPLTLVAGTLANS